MTRAETVSRLATAIRARAAGRSLRVAIDGHSAAGKSTLAVELRERLSALGVPCLAVSIDDFHPPGYKQRAIAGDFTPESYLREGYDWNVLRAFVLEPLSRGGTRRCRPRHWNPAEDRPYPEEWITVAPDTVVVVEGSFLQLPALRPHFDLVIWLDIDWDTLMSRALRRDVAWVGSEEKVRARYETHWIPRHRHYDELVRPQESADVVIDNRDATAPVIIRGLE